MQINLCESLFNTMPYLDIKEQNYSGNVSNKSYQRKELTLLRPLKAFGGISV